MISFNAISIIFLFPILIHGQLWSNDQNQFSPESFATYSQLQGEVPFNRELSIFLFKSEIKRFYFQTFSHTPQTNISITVTPCESTLRWEVFFINSRTIQRLHRRKVRRSKKYFIRFINRKLSNGANTKLLMNHTGTERFTYSEEITQPGLYIIQMASDESVDLRATLYLSNDTFQGSIHYPRIPPVATVLSRQINGKKLQFNNDKIVRQNEINIDKEKIPVAVELWWNPALSTMNQPSFLFEYCVLISTRRHFRDSCLSNVHPNPNEVDFEPNSLQLDGNHYSQLDLLYQSARKRLYEMVEQEFIDNVVYFKCYNQTRTIVQDGLEPKHNYYVDVFVRNRRTNGISRYWGSNFTLNEPVLKNEEDNNRQIRRQLHDSLFTGVFLDAKNRYRTILSYKMEPTSSLMSLANNVVHVFIQLCDGRGPVQLAVRKTFDNQYRSRRDEPNYDDDDLNDQDVLLLEEIFETRTFEITVPIDQRNANRKIILEFDLNTHSIRQDRNLVLLASNDLNRFPFPRLPNDRTIREFESLRDCRKLTLAWYPSPDQRVLYCIMQRDADLINSSFKETRELCSKINPSRTNKRSLIVRQDSSMPEDDDDDDDVDEERFVAPTRKVICRRYKSSKRRRSNLIMQEIRHLQPGKRYIFQVVVTKGRGRSLNYEQLWTETKENNACLA